MGDFDVAWLALRETADRRARDRSLLAGLLSRLAARERVRIVDLGCGTGAQMRFLAPRLAPAQNWLLVDRDPDLLGDLEPRLVPLRALPHVVWSACRRDLATGIGDLSGAADLVTASALLDLVSDAWLEQQCQRWSRFRPLLYFSLNFDGRLRWWPRDPDDAWMVARFNRHQRADKGLGPALGCDAVPALARRLASLGYQVRIARSPWRLARRDRALQRQVIEGCRAAVAEIGGARRAGSWARRRGERLDRGLSCLTVGHLDLLAWAEAGSRTGSPDPSGTVVQAGAAHRAGA